MMLRDRLEAIEADISTLKIDAIVNAANAPLIMGGGVDGAIRRKAGREIEDDLRRIGRCPTGPASSELPSMSAEGLARRTQATAPSRAKNGT